MQGGGHADVLMYFKCLPTQQVQCPVNAYRFRALSGLVQGRFRCSIRRLRQADLLFGHNILKPGDKGDDQGNEAGHHRGEKPG